MHSMTSIPSATFATGVAPTETSTVAEATEIVEGFASVCHSRQIASFLGKDFLGVGEIKQVFGQLRDWSGRLWHDHDKSAASAGLDS